MRAGAAALAAMARRQRVMMRECDMMALLLLLAGTSGAVAAASNCTFHEGRDYSDPAVAGTEHGKNATSAETCCALCFADPQCAAAAFAKPSSAAGAGVGKCYLKVSALQPVERGAGGPTGCDTGRDGRPPGPPAADDDAYDCRFRHLALEFTTSVVLASWAPARAAEARRDVANGLRINQCNGSSAPSGIPATSLSQNLPATTIEPSSLRLFVAPDGDDSASGVATAPLRSIIGAQARIRKVYPAVKTRPAIAVVLRAGDYFVPPRRGSAFVAGAEFGSTDSGSSAAAPIVYAAELDNVTGLPARVTMHGGVLLSAQKLTWVPGVVAGSWQATLPDGLEVDAQDQLFLGGAPMVRARLPNGP